MQSEMKRRRAVIGARWMAQVMRSGERLKTNERRTLAELLDSLADRLDEGRDLPAAEAMSILRHLW